MQLPLLLVLPLASALLSLPSPSGPFAVGTITYALTSTIPDPYNPTTLRRTLLTAFYPTTNTSSPYAPFLPPSTRQFYEASFNLPPNTLSLHTSSHPGAPFHKPHTPATLIFSTALGASRGIYTLFAQSLAADGFMVLVLDHPGETDTVEFPDGSIIISVLPAEPSDADITRAMDVRIADTKFLLDSLPDVLAAIPGNACAAKIGIVGHSFGGAIAAAVIATDSRVVAGVNMDGALRGPYNLKNPFLLIGATHTRANYTSWKTFWGQTRGWKMELHLERAGHMVFSDIAVLAEFLGLRDGPIAPVVEGLVGGGDGRRAAVVVGRFVADFFSWVLRESDRGVLKGGEGWTEMSVVA